MILVIAQHCDLLPIGWIGVWIFFVISGFVVTSSILDEKSNNFSRKDRLKRFYFRRIARIVPLYILYVLLSIFIDILLKYPHSFLESLSLMGFFYNFYRIHDDSGLPISHLWTISVEMQFYLLVGAALILLSLRNLKLLLVSLLCLPVLLRISYSVYAQDAAISPGEIQFWEGRISVFHFDAFAAGCMLSLYRKSITTRLANASLLIGLISIVGIIGIYAVINHVTRNATGIAVFKGILSGPAVGQLREALVYVPASILGVGCVVSAVASRSIAQIFLDWKWVSYVGRCSYSGYIIHFAVIWVIRLCGVNYLGLSDVGERTITIIGERFGLFILATAVTVALSIALFEWIEKPLALMTRRILRY